ncbi:MAG: sulfotransferase [Actinomycetota bacterium]|nr:sulfotransferase [Actinomycetota bacterium]
MSDTMRAEFARAGVRSPNVFIVGAPKCATTAMSEALARHPSVFMSPVKEPHRFGADLPALHVRTPMPAPDYIGLFEGATNESSVAEASVWTMRSASAAAEIKAFEPEARIIIMLRDPIEMLASLHGELCRAGVEDILELRTALEAEPDRRAGRRIPSGVERHGQLLYSEAVAFPEQVQRFVDVFGKPALRVVLLDEIRTDPESVMSGVQRFLGLEHRDDVRLVASNEGRSVKVARLQRFARQPGLARSVARRLVPAAARPRVARVVKDSIERVNLTPAGRSSMPVDLERELRDRYRDSIDRLAEILGRDLSGWM